MMKQFEECFKLDQLPIVIGRELRDKKSEISHITSVSFEQEKIVVKGFCNWKTIVVECVEDSFNEGVDNNPTFTKGEKYNCGQREGVLVAKGNIANIYFIAFDKHNDWENDSNFAKHFRVM